MGIFDWIIRLIFFVWLGALSVGFADLAIQLQTQAIKAYQKGPVSASTFTQMMTREK